MINKKQQSGFALLMSIIVVGVVVSVGLSLSELATKQLNLSTNSKESETAFHAANAGVECAQYWRFNKAETLEAGDDFNFRCFNEGENVAASDPTSLGLSVNRADAYLYRKNFTWNSGSGDRCSDVSMLIINSSSNIDKAEISGMKNVFSGYPDDTFECEIGGRCAIISAQGYSASCASVGNIGVVQREVLLES